MTLKRKTEILKISRFCQELTKIMYFLTLFRNQKSEYVAEPDYLFRERYIPCNFHNSFLRSYVLILFSRLPDFGCFGLSANLKRRRLVLLKHTVSRIVIQCLVTVCLFIFRCSAGPKQDIRYRVDLNENLNLVSHT